MTVHFGQITISMVPRIIYHCLIYSSIQDFMCQHSTACVFNKWLQKDCPKKQINAQIQQLQQ